MTIYLRTRKLTFLKLIALFLSINFTLFESLLYAQIPNGVSMPSSALPALKIPHSLASIQETYQGSSGRSIFFIQDAHDSLEAQENIARLIQYLVAKKKVQTVLEEGYEGPVPTRKFFGFIRDPNLKRKVAHHFVDRLRLGGAEFAHVVGKPDFQLIGADRLKLHRQNVAWYQRATEFQRQNEVDLNVLAQEIQKLAARHFPPELKTWMKLKNQLEEGSVDLMDYLKRIDFDLREMEVGNNDPILLLRKIESYERRRLEQMIQDMASRKIFLYLESIKCFEKLNRLELSTGEYQTVKKTLTPSMTREMAKFIVSETGKPIALSKSWETHIRPALKFYETAEKRDKVLGRLLRASGPSPMVLVYGGFHKDRITEILRHYKYSYCVISPAISQEDKAHQLLYQRLMSGQMDTASSIQNSNSSRVPSILVEHNAKAEISRVYQEIRRNELRSALKKKLPPVNYRHLMSPWRLSQEQAIIRAYQMQQIQKKYHLISMPILGLGPMIALSLKQIDVKDPKIIGAALSILVFNGIGVLAYRKLQKVFSANKNQMKLVTSGIFKYTQHPIYFFGALGFFLASVISLHSWVVVLAAVFGLGISAEMIVERNVLWVLMGKSYREYVERTPFFVPWFVRDSKSQRSELRKSSESAWTSISIREVEDFFFGQSDKKIWKKWMRELKESDLNFYALVAVILYLIKNSESSKKLGLEHENSRVNWIRSKLQWAVSGTRMGAVEDSFYKYIHARLEHYAASPEFKQQWMASFDEEKSFFQVDRAALNGSMDNSGLSNMDARSALNVHAPDGLWARSIEKLEVGMNANQFLECKRPIFIMRIQYGDYQNVYLVLSPDKEEKGFAAFILMIPRDLHFESSPQVVRDEFSHLSGQSPSGFTTSMLAFDGDESDGVRMPAYTSRFLDRHDEVVYEARDQKWRWGGRGGDFVVNSSIPWRLAIVPRRFSEKVVGAFALAVTRHYDPQKRTLLGEMLSERGDLNFAHDAFRRRYWKDGKLVTAVAQRDILNKTRLIAFRDLHQDVTPALFLHYLFGLGYLVNDRDQINDAPPLDDVLRKGVFLGLRRGLVEKYGPQKAPSILRDWLRQYLQIVESPGTRIKPDPLFTPQFLRSRSELRSRISVPKTYFGRDGLAINEAVRLMLDRLKPGEEFRVLTLGSSSGQEGYDVAMAIADHLDLTQKKINATVVITDIDPELVAMAREGIYPITSIKRTPGADYADLSEDQYLRRMEKYFTAISDEAVRILKPEEFKTRWGIQLQFESVDVLSKEHMQRVAENGAYHLVVARNVQYSSHLRKDEEKNKAEILFFNNLLSSLSTTGRVMTAYQFFDSFLFGQGILHEASLALLSREELEHYLRSRSPFLKQDVISPGFTIQALKIEAGLRELFENPDSVLASWAIPGHGKWALEKTWNSFFQNSVLMPRDGSIFPAIIFLLANPRVSEKYKREFRSRVQYLLMTSQAFSMQFYNYVGHVTPSLTDEADQELKRNLALIPDFRVRRSELRNQTEFIRQAREKLAIIEVGIYPPSRTPGSGVGTYILHNLEQYHSLGINTGVIGTGDLSTNLEQFPFLQFLIPLPVAPFFDAYPGLKNTILFSQLSDETLRRYEETLYRKMKLWVELIKSLRVGKRIILNVHDGGPIALAAQKVRDEINRVDPGRVVSGVVGHNMDLLHYQDFPEPVRSAFRDAARGADYYVTITENQADETSHLYGLDRQQIRVIPHGVDTALIDPANIPATSTLPDALRGIDPNNSHVLLYWGRVVPGKGVIKAIDGFEAYMTGKPLREKTYFVIAGSGKPDYEEAVRLRIARLPEAIQGKVIRIPYGKYQDLPSVFKLADASILLSGSEVLSRSVLESFAMGKPVIASDIPGLRASFEANHNGGNKRPEDLGVLVRSYRDPQVVAGALRETFQKVETGAWDAGLIRAHVVKNFSAEQALNSQLGLYLRSELRREQAEEFSEATMLDHLNWIHLHPDYVFDSLIIGGGAAGAGAFRNRARRKNTSTLLVEEDVFAGKTSSKSSKFIHPGLWYLYLVGIHLGKAFRALYEEDNRLAHKKFYANLKTAWENFGLVFGGIQRRKILIQNTDGIVTPLPFNAVIHKDIPFGKWLSFLGIAAYEILSKLRGAHDGKTRYHWNARSVAGAFPFLNVQSILGAVTYWDAKANNDKVLVVHTIRDSIRKDEKYPAYALAKTRFVKSSWVDGVSGEPGYFLVTLSTKLPGSAAVSELTVRSRVLVNAAGVMIDQIQRQESGDSKRRVAVSRGTHIEVTNQRLQELAPRYFSQATTILNGKRRYFVIPRFENGIWYLRIGPTDRVHDDLANVYPTPEEVDELIEAFNQSINDQEEFRDFKISRDDIYFADAGLRNMAAPEDPETPLGDISRMFRTPETGKGGGVIIHAIGVKLTEMEWAGEVIGNQIQKILKRMGVGKSGDSSADYQKLKRVKGDDEFRLDSPQYQRSDSRWLERRIEHLVRNSALLDFSEFMFSYGGLRDAIRFSEKGKPVIDQAQVRRLFDSMAKIRKWSPEQIRIQMDQYLNELQKNLTSLTPASPERSELRNKKGQILVRTSDLGVFSGKQMDELLVAVNGRSELRLILHSNSDLVSGEAGRRRDQLMKLRNVIVTDSDRDLAIERWAWPGSVAVELMRTSERLKPKLNFGKRIGKLKHVELKDEPGRILMARELVFSPDGKLWWTREVNGFVEPFPGYLQPIQEYLNQQVVEWAA